MSERIVLACEFYPGGKTYDFDASGVTGIEDIKPGDKVVAVLSRGPKKVTVVEVKDTSDLDVLAPIQSIVREDEE